MIDVHCHLEQKDFDNDREELIKELKKELKAVITSCAHPRDFETTINIAKANKGFIFPSFGFHPEFAKEKSDEYKDLIKQNQKECVAIGEIGLDYYYARTLEEQNLQKEVFREWLSFAKELKKPVTIHIRDAFEDALRILDSEDLQRVHLHMFGGYKFTDLVKEKKYFVSLNTMLLKSKSYKRVARDIPIEQIMLETDSPWLGLNNKRNDPRSVKIVAEEIAKIKKIDLKVVEEKTDFNAIKFFNLNLRQ
ncbi:MAG: TatD family hydrolase [Candidatus Micrarchaeales archaeon]